MSGGAPPSAAELEPALIYEPDPALEFRLKPNASARMLVLGRTLTMDVDGEGCRPVVGRPNAGDKTIAAFGCAFTYGAGVTAAETFCSLLQGMIPGWRVENHGVGGYTTVHNLIQLERRLSGNQPDFVTFCWVDEHRRGNVASLAGAQHASSRQLGSTAGSTEWRAPRAGLDPNGALSPRSVTIPRHDLAGIDFSGFEPDPHYLDLVCFRLLERAHAMVTGYGGHFFVTTLQGRLSKFFAEQMEEAGIPVVDASVPVKDYACLPDKVYPNALAHSVYAEQIRIYLQRYTTGYAFRQATVPVQILSRARNPTRTVENIRYHSSETIPGALVQAGADFQVFEGYPDRILELADAFFIPGSMCLYDRGGQRIPESCTRRGKDLAEFVHAGSDTIRLPDDFITVDEPLVYLSWLPNHWGDFLTEGASRLWAMLRYPEVAAFGGFYLSPRPVHRNIMEFLGSLGWTIRTGCYDHGKPVRFRKVFIPAASFCNRGEAWLVHRGAATAVSEAHLRDDRIEVSDQPVFLSRSQFESDRDIRNQEQLERALTAMKFLVVHPERLSLAGQISLFNRHRYFAGLWGSAFHTAILSREPASITTHVISHYIPNVNFLMFDSILGNNANYVGTLFPVPESEQIWPHLKMSIDVEQTVAYFRGIL